MINKAIAFIARLTIGKHLVSAVASINDKAKGHRSEINLAVLAIVHGLKIAGVIPESAADSIENILLGILPITLADKASKVRDTLNKIVPAPVADPAPENDSQAKPS